METYVIHENEVTAKNLPGRKHKMVVRPDNMGTKNMCAGVAVFPGNAHAPSHLHEKEEEVLYVLKGEGNIYFEGKSEQIREGSFMFVPKGMQHSLEATTEKDLKVFYVFSPPVEQGSYDRK